MITATTTTIIIAAVIVFAITIAIAIFATGYRKAPSNMAYIVSGITKQPRIISGKAGVIVPFLERVDKLPLGVIQIDVKTSSYVPTAEYINVKVDSNVNVKVGESIDMIRLASQNFLNTSKEEINRKVVALLEGNVREIVGQMKLTDMVSDRKAFSEKVQENAVPDLAKLGLELISFNVQNFTDENDVITNLGIDNVEQIRKNAAIAKSDAQREIAIAEAENAKSANDAQIKAKEDIIARNNDLKIKEAQLKKIADTEKAQADAAEAIEAQKQRELRDVAAMNADIARAEREAELKKQEIELKERELDALVRKQADADRYALEQKVAAEFVARQKKAEAERYDMEQKAAAARFEMEQRAEAQKIKAEADKIAAFAQAEGIAAVGKAEAEAIELRAEAQKKMGEASVLEMYFQMLPNAVASAAAPLENVGNITMYGDGNQSKLVGDVMKTVNQVTEGMKANGIDIASLIAGALSKKDSK